MIPAAFGVKQFLARLRSLVTRVHFNIFETVDPAFHLLDLLDANGFSTYIQFPFREGELRPEYWAALKHGWGQHALRGRENYPLVSRVRLSLRSATP